MRVDQAGEQPAFGGQPGSADRVVGPPVTVREQVNNIAAGQGTPANPHDTHQTTLTAATGDREGTIALPNSLLARQHMQVKRRLPRHRPRDLVDVLEKDPAIEAAAF